ncbi:hypothetical protein NY2A_b569L [Paramecium bursaria Chlorella virus NY2A]|uniref:Uncharacterized protein b569L n=1 Tax=Paramecium bursaria Chlorella virus NY2A TaxID=46021 RepID=A7IX94_PBCVN|nr:hypothetical protein NY2A_b569L [Paramecium bursaria Chlorella virus NY2A]ABT14968.1 hypothetical protein NY2A_b569L [Paramecium bursaria Chlorella virus NY2A]
MQKLKRYSNAILIILVSTNHSVDQTENVLRYTNVRRPKTSACTNKPVDVGTPNIVTNGMFSFFPIRSFVSLYIVGEDTMMNVKIVKSTSCVLTDSIVKYIKYFFCACIMIYFFIIVINKLWILMTTCRTQLS